MSWRYGMILFGMVFHRSAHRWLRTAALTLALGLVSPGAAAARVSRTVQSIEFKEEARISLTNATT